MKEENLPPTAAPDLERPLWIDTWHQAFLKAHGKAPDVVPGLRAMDARRKKTTLAEWRARIENCFGNPFTKNFTLLEFAGLKWDKCTSPYQDKNQVNTKPPKKTIPYTPPIIPEGQEATGSLLDGMMAELKKKVNV